MASGRAVVRTGTAKEVAGKAFDGWDIVLGGVRLTADRSGVLFIAAARVLIVADLHLEKGSSRARFGALLPPYDTRATLRRLSAAIERLAPRQVIALGDSFHDAGGGARLCLEDRATLAGMQRGRQWLWIAGNHDREMTAGLGGDRAPDWRHAGLVFRHEPADSHEVAGHLHPCARVARGGHVQRRPCFAFGSGRLIMPAFGSYTGGLNVMDAALGGLFANDLAVAVLGRNGIYPIATEQLRPD